MTWKFDNRLATLHGSMLSGQVDVAHPHLGLHQLRLESTTLAGRICCVERDASANSLTSVWPAKLQEAYVRGDDIVATYQATEDWPFAPQIYWRSNTLRSIDQVLESLSLLVSVSTHLLDTHPQISAVTQLAADEVLHVTLSSDDNVQTNTVLGEDRMSLHPDGSVGCLLWRLPGGKVSYAEIVPANDFRQLTIHHENDGTCLARWELIAEFLEKGVIRRTRLQSAFLPRELDVKLSVDCCRQVVSRPLPLTT